MPFTANMPAKLEDRLAAAANYLQGLCDAIDPDNKTGARDQVRMLYKEGGVPPPTISGPVFAEVVAEMQAVEDCLDELVRDEAGITRLQLMVNLANLLAEVRRIRRRERTDRPVTVGVDLAAEGQPSQSYTGLIVRREHLDALRKALQPFVGIAGELPADAVPTAKIMVRSILLPDSTGPMTVADFNALQAAYTSLLPVFNSLVEDV